MQSGKSQHTHAPHSLADVAVTGLRSSRCESNTNTAARSVSNSVISSSRAPAGARTRLRGRGLGSRWGGGLDARPGAEHLDVDAVLLDGAQDLLEFGLGGVAL